MLYDKKQTNPDKHHYPGLQKTTTDRMWCTHLTDRPRQRTGHFHFLLPLRLCLSVSVSFNAFHHSRWISGLSNFIPLNLTSHPIMPVSKSLKITRIILGSVATLCFFLPIFALTFVAVTTWHWTKPVCLVSWPGTIYFILLKWVLSYRISLWLDHCSNLNVTASCGLTPLFTMCSKLTATTCCVTQQFHFFVSCSLDCNLKFWLCSLSSMCVHQ